MPAMTKSKVLSTERPVQSQVPMPIPVVAPMSGREMPQRTAAASLARRMDATGTIAEFAPHPVRIGAQGVTRRAELSKTLQRSMGNARLGRMAAPAGRPQQGQKRSSGFLALASAREGVQRK